jgi:hypothetical protein
VLATLVIGGLALSGGAQLAKARREVDFAKSELRTARQAATSRQNEAATASLGKAQAHLDAAGRIGDSFPLGLLRPLPLLGSPSRSLAATARAGREAVTAGRILVDASASFPTSSRSGGVNAADLSPFHDAAVRSEQAVAEAETHLSRAKEELAGAAGAFLPQVSGPARGVRAEIDRSTAQLEGVRRGLSLVADVTGPSSETRLLVLAQDSLELRPTGGYIGSYGVLHFSSGTARIETYAATEDLPPPDPPMEPPAELAASLPKHWGLSNVNWWPDFPTTATTAREMFRRQGGGEVDGILGITELATARLIGALGPLTVPGYAQPVVAEGFDERVVYEVELKFPQDQPRKKFLIALANVLFDRLLHLPGDRLPAVAEAVEESVGAGDIQLWFADEARQRQLEVSVIAGRLPAPGQDFLLVVDANLTASKANLGLRKQMDYRVRREGDRFVATLEIEARNERPTSPVNRYYNGLLRVYVPKGTKLVSPRPGQFVQPAADGPFDIVGQRILVEPEDRRVVRFDYTLPPTVAPDGDYRLRWLRQPGTPRDTLRAVVHQRTSVADPRRRVLEVSRSMDGEGITDRIRNWGPIRKLLD